MSMLCRVEPPLRRLFYACIKGRTARGKEEREGGETPRARHKPKRIGVGSNAQGKGTKGCRMCSAGC